MQILGTVAQHAYIYACQACQQVYIIYYKIINECLPASALNTGGIMSVKVLIIYSKQLVIIT